MKILVLSAWYAPFIHPRAHRWTVLAEYWAAAGHEVTVLTANVRGQPKESQSSGVRVLRCGYDALKEAVYALFPKMPARGRTGQKPQRISRLQRGLNAIYRHVWKNLYFPDDACIWYFPARKKLRALLENESFDVLISVSLPFSAHLVAQHTLQTLKNPPRWVADIGDPFSLQAVSPNNRRLYGALNRRLERSVLTGADAVCVTHPSTLQLYADTWGSAATRRMQVIPPLWQAGPAPAEACRPSGRIKIGYFGALYAPVRTPDAFLCLLKTIRKLRPDRLEDLEIHFYGEIFPEFYDRLAEEPVIRLHGLQTREAVRQAMHEMDILLNIGNASDFQLPSKAVDYLGAGKPILHLSYVERDPFSAFFVGQLPASLFFILPVQGNIPNETGIEACLQWMWAEKPVLSPEVLAALVAPYRVEQIAGAYERLM
jgi:hypothetical protein